MWLRGTVIQDVPSAPVSPSASLSPSVSASASATTSQSEGASVSPSSSLSPHVSVSHSLAAPSPAAPDELFKDDAEVWLDKIERLRRLIQRKKASAPWLEDAIVEAHDLGLLGYEERVGIGDASHAGGPIGGHITGEETTKSAQWRRAQITQLADAFRRLDQSDSSKKPRRAGSNPGSTNAVT